MDDVDSFREIGLFEAILKNFPVERIESSWSTSPDSFVEAFEFDGLAVAVGLFDLLTAIDFGLCEAVVAGMPDE